MENIYKEKCSKKLKDWPELTRWKGFPGTQRVKHLPAMQETWVRSPGQKDPLEKEMATHSSAIAWKIPWS